MSPHSQRGYEPKSCFPRMSGDEPANGQVFERIREFSPHERG